MVQKVLGSKFQVKTFSVRYDKELSKHAKLVLQSFRLKFYYYVMDDILYSLKLNPNLSSPRIGFPIDEKCLLS